MQGPQDPSRGGSAERLNQACFCRTLDRAALDRSLRDRLGDTGTFTDEHRHLFSATPIFVPQADVARMQQIVQAIEAAAARR